MKKTHLYFSIFFACVINHAGATDCSNALVLQNVPQTFMDRDYHSHALGNYTISLISTLHDIADGAANSNGYQIPDYKKPWTGACPSGLSGACFEFTVYPGAAQANFSPNNIMQKIEQYTSGHPNRGEVRIITDAAETHYVYSTDHERTFCGPYLVPTA